MEILIGSVEDFFAHVGVMAVKLEDDLSIGDTIHIKGHTTDFIQTVDSIQINHQPVQHAKKGDDVGIKINERVRRGDKIYKIT